MRISQNDIKLLKSSLEDDKNNLTNTVEKSSVVGGGDYTNNPISIAQNIAQEKVMGRLKKKSKNRRKMMER